MSSGQKRSSWVADFETTTRIDDCRVWGWGLANVDTASTLWDVEIGQTLDEFVTRIAKMDSICYFHNLKFDGAFILDWLFRHKFAHASGFIKKGYFKTLISGMGDFFTITVAWKNGKKTEFRDSHKKLPYPVNVIGKAFGLEIAKGEIDYKKDRPLGYVITPKEREYIALDVLIVAQALKMELDAGMTRLTVGSDSLFEFKNIINPKVFSRYFPILSDTIDSEIRLSYRGGYTYVAKRFAGKRLGVGRVYDVNSLYPSVMYSNLLPYGEPTFVIGEPVITEEYPLFIAGITFTAKLKKDHIPCIQIKGSGRYVATEYQEEISEPLFMMVNNVDLELWREQYDIEILSWENAWMFSGKSGLFKDYIDKWMEVKKNSTGGMRELAKLHLNSLYGKFASNPDVTPKIPVFDREKDMVKMVTGDPEVTDPIYTAMGSFITAYARAVTIRAAQANYERFVYCDTDSIHILGTGDPIGVDVDPKALGAWKFEYSFSEARFIRAKTYIEHMHPEHWKTETLVDGTEWVRQFETHIAGLPAKPTRQLTLDNMVPGMKLKDKLTPKRVPGGIVLEDVGFTIPVW